MAKPKSPCRDCPDRYLSCHDKCEKYQKYKKDLYEFSYQVTMYNGHTKYFKKSCRRRKNAYYNKTSRKHNDNYFEAHGEGGGI